MAAAESPPSRVRRLSLQRNFSWTLVGNVTFAACQWLNLVVLAKLCDPATVGRFALGLAVTAPVYMLANLQLRSVQATDAAREYRFGHYLALRLLTTMLALIVLPAVVFLAGYTGATAGVILVLGVGKALDALTDVSLGLVQQCERLDRAARARMISGLVSVLGLSTAVVLTRDVLWGAVGWSCGPLVTVLTTRWWMGADVWYLAGSNGRGPRPLFSAEPLRRLARLALPLGMAMMLVSLNTNLPRYFLKSERSEYELGIYAAMAYLMLAGHIVAGALAQAVTPRLAHLFFEEDRRGFWSLLRRLLLLAIAGAALGLALSATIGQPLLTLLYSPEYARYRLVLLVLTAATGLEFASSFLGEAMTAARRFREQLPLFVVVSGTTWLACSLLVPRWGLLGAALGTSAGAAVQIVGSFLVVWNATRLLGKSSS